MTTRSLEQIRDAGTVDVVIDDYGYRGEGYVELDDGWLSVPGALPGERVRVKPEDEIVEGVRLFARVVEILEASDRRRDPICPRDDVCRGCQLRHVSVEEELRFKRRTVREVVEKYAGLPADAQPEIETITPRPIRRHDAYRIRTRLNYVHEPDGSWDLGLVTPVLPERIPMSDCPALTESTQRLVTHVERALDDLETLPPAFRPPSEGDAGRPGLRYVSIATPTLGRGLVAADFAGLESTEAFVELLEHPGIESFLEKLADRLPEDVGLSAHGRSTRESFKAPERITLPFANLRIQAGFDDWFPATLEPTRVLYETLLEELLELRPTDRYLDVGCGVGTLSLLVAPRVRSATGIDINRNSIEAAELNAVRNEIDNVAFLPSGWEKALRERLLEGASVDVATVNPMREPLGERPLAYLHQIGPRQIVYLGPSPEAAAKDIGILREKGWQIAGLASANLHPATYHTMLVADLRA